MGPEIDEIREFGDSGFTVGVPQTVSGRRWQAPSLGEEMRNFISAKALVGANIRVNDQRQGSFGGGGDAVACESWPCIGMCLQFHMVTGGAYFEFSSPSWILFCSSFHILQLIGRIRNVVYLHGNMPRLLRLLLQLVKRLWRKGKGAVLCAAINHVRDYHAEDTTWSISRVTVHMIIKLERKKRKAEKKTVAWRDAQLYMRQ